MANNLAQRERGTMQTRRARIDGESNELSWNQLETSDERFEFEIVKGASKTENQEQIAGIVAWNAREIECAKH